MEKMEGQLEEKALKQIGKFKIEFMEEVMH